MLPTGANQAAYALSSNSLKQGLHFCRNELYFLTPLYKAMPLPQDSRQLIRQEMRARGEATRPQLARACGLSLVTVNRVVARLCAAGELEPAGEVSSGGGRPVQLYRLRRSGTWAALLRFSRGGNGILKGELELLDPLGELLRQEQARFGHLEEGTLDQWLDGILRHQRRRLLSITVESRNTPLPPALCRHLSARYRCPCRLATLADALCEPREGSCTLVLEPGEPPQASLWQRGERHSSTALELLPLPADWHYLDYSDHTLVEEMVARLLLILTCSLSASRFVLHAPFWSERLQQRIAYNLSTKLRATPLPQLHFRSLTAQLCHNALQHLALEGEAAAPQM